MKDTVNILYPHITIYIQAIDASTATDRLIVAILLPGFILAILSLNAVYARKNITATPVISRYRLSFAHALHSINSPQIDSFYAAQFVTAIAFDALFLVQDGFFIFYLQSFARTRLGANSASDASVA